MDHVQWYMKEEHTLSNLKKLQYITIVRLDSMSKI